MTCHPHQPSPGEQASLRLAGDLAAAQHLSRGPRSAGHNRPLGAAHQPGDRVWIVDEHTGVGHWKTVADTIPMVDLVFADGTRHLEPADVDAARKSNEWTAKFYRRLAAEAALRADTPPDPLDTLLDAPFGGGPVPTIADLDAARNGGVPA